MYRFVCVRPGNANTSSDGIFSAECSISLILGAFNILFDPGSPWDGLLITKMLSDHGLKSSEVAFVVCSHPHIDHVGNLNFFPDATIVVGTEVTKHDELYQHPISYNNPFRIDDKVEIIFTPGHTESDVSLVVRDTEDYGTVVLTGDVFENEHDIGQPSLWMNNSINPALQDQSRKNLLKIADYIVPGHGAAFHVSDVSNII
uniref:Metallo-beta-lactamase domain-containing protein 1 n=1 Tax=Schistocephalus solidus TaxID=70667 RepID=A0A0X3PAT5_SCHSO